MENSSMDGDFVFFAWFAGNQMRVSGSHPLFSWREKIRF
jgi:hypothetical protein